ncbi:MAG TPA: NAD(P)H-binding protein [Thermoanaerobaculia bacterium]|nr:NAD(P)H-binding protein [Thermoanaerobaculia bacterium]
MRVLIFGATGSAGGSVLRACLASPAVDEVRTITRRAPRIEHEKLRPFIHADFLDYSAVAGAFEGIDAVLFCLGVSSTQVSEDEYRRITHDFAIAAAKAMQAGSPGAAFHFISGTGTRADSRMMWSRVKAATESELMALVGAICWRPAAIDGVPSDSEPRIIKFLRPFYRLFKPFHGLYISGNDLGRAMIQATAEGMRNRVLENAEMRTVAERAVTA